MEDLAKPVALNHEMVETLDQIRAGAENALYGASPEQAEELFKKHLASMVVGSGMPGLQVMPTNGSCANSRASGVRARAGTLRSTSNSPSASG
jgi:hypothetical protein